jgi:hypothetical protein
MSILPGFKLCSKGLHQYLTNKKTCPECRKQYQKHWRSKNKKRTEIKDQEYRKKYYKKNKEKLLKQNKEWKTKNRERHLELCSTWHKNNPEKSRALYAKQRAAKKQAVAAWADLEEIKKIYKKAVQLTRESGVVHHVDHIYPLTSKYMCGLHVETNLQILIAEENIAKSNRFWPGQLDCQKE